MVTALAFCGRLARPAAPVSVAAVIEPAAVSVRAAVVVSETVCPAAFSAPPTARAFVPLFSVNAPPLLANGPSVPMLVFGASSVVVVPALPVSVGADTAPAEAVMAPVLYNPSDLTFGSAKSALTVMLPAVVVPAMLPSTRVGADPASAARSAGVSTRLLVCGWGAAATINA